MVIELENVSLIKDGEEILHNVTWKVNEGEHWVLFGLNGAGKSVILSLLNGYYYPTKGTVRVLNYEFGKVDIREKIRRKIGLVSSSLQEKLYKTDNAYEIVLSGAFTSIGLYETPTDEMREKAITLMKQLGCFKYANRNYGLLSQGEKQRVLIARALMNEPKILILDEPTNGLDFVAREQLLETIEQIAQKENGPNLIYVTHHVDEILPEFKKILLLRKGKVYETGDTKEIINSETFSDFFEMPVEVIWKNNRPLLSKIK